MAETDDDKFMRHTELMSQLSRINDEIDECNARIHREMRFRSLLEEKHDKLRDALEEFHPNR
jgi:predicted nuclease with TOPRIM domain